MMGADHQPDPEFKYRELFSEARHNIIELLKRRLSEDSGIILAYVHGGFANEGYFRDIDVALWIEDEGDAWRYAVDLSADLEVEIGIPVDLQVLNEAPLPLRYTVLTQGRLILSKDEELRTRLLDSTQRQYIDLRHMNEFYKGE